MRYVFYTFWAVVTLTACSTPPSYHQPVTEVARAVRMSYQELENIAPKADSQAKAAFLKLYHASPTARESLRLSPRGCTREAARAGESCYAEMELPGSGGLTIRAGNDLTQAVRLTRQLALYTLWLKKISAADNCRAVGHATQAAFAQGVKLYELTARKDFPASVNIAAAPARLGVCLYLDRRKLKALQEATQLADPAVKAASAHLVRLLKARAFISAAYLRAELARLEADMLPDNTEDVKEKAAAQYIETVGALDRSLKYTAGLTALAEGLGPSHTALTEALASKQPNFVKIYRAAQTLRQGLALLAQAFELEDK